jgi:polyhydroxybutyrate depolymerase
MKTKLFFLSLLFFGFITSSQAGWTNKSFTFETLTRQYRIYVPTMYNPGNPASLVIGLHGLGDNMTNFSSTGFSDIADTANIIVIIPQAIADPTYGTAWNSRAGAMGIYPNSTVNDVGFINALVDTAMAKYSINPLKVYLFGFSMGGFMAERMALQSNGKFAAFASASGTFGNGLTVTHISRAVPIMHCHGTADGTVGYYTNNFGNTPEVMVKWWVTNNHCDTTAIHFDFPNTKNDGDTVERFVYPNGLQNSEVEFYKVRGGAHDWLWDPNNDIDYAVEMWTFFRRHINEVYNVNERPDVVKNITVYPNPANDHIDIQIPDITQGETLTYQLLNIQGAIVMKGQINSSFYQLPISQAGLTNGIYLLRISSGSSQSAQRIVIAK